MWCGLAIAGTDPVKRLARLLLIALVLEAIAYYGAVWVETDTPDPRCAFLPHDWIAAHHLSAAGDKTHCERITEP